MLTGVLCLLLCALTHAAVVTPLPGGKSTEVICPFQNCKCEDTVIDCSNRGWIAIPKYNKEYSKGYTKLLLNNNKLVKLEANSFPADLDEIDLRGNILTNIAQGAFNGNRHLHTLRMSEVNFQQLPEELASLENLEILEISQSRVNKWTESVISELSNSLVSLNLDNVGLSAFPEWLTKFGYLRRLSLAGNPINQIRDKLAQWSNQLTHLNLAKTGQQNTDFLNSLRKLQRLNLKGNKISDHVGLSYALIVARDSIKHIDLSDNNLSIMPRLAELGKLQEINLSNNILMIGNMDALPQGLRILNLEGNKFQEIPSFILDLPHLETLNLKRNKITELKEGEFPQDYGLTKLYLGRNDIAKVDHRALDNIVKIKYLDLSFTKLPTLPLALENLTSLETLFIPGNDNLQCTCAQLALSAWFASHSQLHVVGDCEKQDVKEYFTLAPTLCVDQV